MSPDNWMVTRQELLFEWRHLQEVLESSGLAILHQFKFDQNCRHAKVTYHF